MEWLRQTELTAPAFFGDSHSNGTPFPFVSSFSVDRPPSTVSYHYPLHRILGGIWLLSYKELGVPIEHLLNLLPRELSLRVAPSQLLRLAAAPEIASRGDGSGICNDLGRLPFLQVLLERPLRASVLVAQVKSGRWVRNGNVVWGPTAIYSSSYWADHGFTLFLFSFPSFSKRKKMCAFSAGWTWTM